MTTGLRTWSLPPNLIWVVRVDVIWTCRGNGESVCSMQFLKRAYSSSWSHKRHSYWLCVDKSQIAWVEHNLMNPNAPMKPNEIGPFQAFVLRCWKEVNKVQFLGQRERLWIRPSPKKDSILRSGDGWMVVLFRSLTNSNQLSNNL